MKRLPPPRNRIGPLVIDVQAPRVACLVGQHEAYLVEQVVERCGCLIEWWFGRVTCGEPLCEEHGRPKWAPLTTHACAKHTTTRSAP